MKHSTYVLVAAFIIIIAIVVMRGRDSIDIPKGETIVVNENAQGERAPNEIEEFVIDVAKLATSATGDEVTGDASDSTTVEVTEKTQVAQTSDRALLSTDGTLHSIPLNEIRQGCFGRDCIPSVDTPVFISTSEADRLLPDDTIGIGLEYKGVKRFYPFNMLVTREIVNDMVAGDALVVTYCPLCGTGIVFDRTIDGEVMEFGVSGMLWQSNLLMYNRNDTEENVSLWSQVLGEAVLGVHTGTVLEVIPSDVVLFADWKKAHTDSEVLNTGRIGDPYGGNYFSVAKNFNPDFDENDSAVPPMTPVLGIEIDGSYKAYVKDALPEGETQDTVGGQDIVITKNETGQVRIVDASRGESISMVTGFWFSWVAVHPETELMM